MLARLQFERVQETCLPECNVVVKGAACKQTLLSAVVKTSGIDAIWRRFRPASECVVGTPSKFYGRSSRPRTILLRL